MKRSPIKVIVSLILVVVASCGEPETVVTDIVHPDGSVTRKLEMKTMDNNFDISNIQVPFDSTWIVRDSLEIDEDGDTLWIKRAWKLFANVGEINTAYLADSGSNKDVSRRAEFSKKFRWFNTEYRFTEIIDKTMSHGYPVSEFLNEEELAWFHSPENITRDQINGPDSLKYKAFNDTVEKKIEKWTVKSLVSEWIGEFTKLTEGKAEGDMATDALKTREDEFVKIIEKGGEDFDSLWSNGLLLKEFIGEANAIRYQAEADSADNIVSEHLWVDFVHYTQKIVMPGEIIGTNGFIDSTKTLLWPVQSDYFMTEPYVMYAESKIPNKWAWIVSGIFLLFVLAGIIFRVIKK